MGKELEIKVLDVNVEVMKKRLEQIGATFKFDEMQKIYTYDFINIPSQFRAIINDFRYKKSQKIITSSIKRLEQLCFDVDDLIKEFDSEYSQREIIKEVFGVESFSEALQGIKDNIDLVIEKFSDEKIWRVFSTYNINPNKWIRLRNTGHTTTLAIKHILGRYTDDNGVRHHDVSNVLEYEVSVSSFEETKKIIELLGYYHKNYQEKRRIQYIYQGMEIDIDLWPHIPPYLEIEADSTEKIQSILKKLEIDHNSITSMNTDDVYTKYGLNMYDYKELKF